MPSLHRRIDCLDQARALSILFMVWAHLGSGILARTPIGPDWRLFLILLGRLATPGFITVFGLTVGAVYWKSWTGQKRIRRIKSLHRRSFWVFVCALLFFVPRVIELRLEPNVQPIRYAFTLYSVLVFYTLAITTLPFWLDLVRKRFVPLSIVAGVSLWLFQSWLAFYSYTQQDLPLEIQLITMALVNGAYGYFALMGHALLCMPIGYLLSKSFEGHDPKRPLVWVTLIGMAMTVLGVQWAIACGEFDLVEISRGAAGDLKNPPRFWYFNFFGGMMIVITGILGLLGRFIPSILSILLPLTLLGRRPLAVVLAQAYVLPLIKLGKYYVTIIPDFLVELLVVWLFVIYCALLIVFEFRKVRRRDQSSQRSPVLRTDQRATTDSAQSGIPR